MKLIRARSARHRSGDEFRSPYSYSISFCSNTDYTLPSTYSINNRFHHRPHSMRAALCPDEMEVKRAAFRPTTAITLTIRKNLYDKTTGAARTFVLRVGHRLRWSSQFSVTLVEVFRASHLQVTMTVNTCQRHSEYLVHAVCPWRGDKDLPC